MSWHNPGIHLFYPNGPNLAHAFYDGLNWTGGQQITIQGAPIGWTTPAGAEGTKIRVQGSLLPPINSGVSAIYLSSENKIYVFYTGKDTSVYVMAYALDTSILQYIGNVPGVTTTDVTAAVEQSGNVNLYYKDSGSVNNAGPAYTVLQFSGDSMSVVAAPVAIGIQGQPTQWGPAAVMRTGSPNLVYGDSNGNLRLAWQRSGSSWAQLDPTGAQLKYAPTAVLAGDMIFALYHSQSSQDLYCDVCDPSGNWTQNVANSGDLKNVQDVVGGGPGACVFGSRVYCFMQGPNMEMYCQVFLGHKWQGAPLLVTDNSGNALCTNVWWGPAAVAV